MMSKLVNVKEAMVALKVSRGYLYKLPLGTPGIYQFGRSKRFSIEELKAWARQQAISK